MSRALMSGHITSLRIIQMKRFIFFAAIAAVTLSLNAQKTVNVATPGSLGTLLTQEEQNTLTKLTITGELNSADIKVLRAMTKTKSDRMASSPVVGNGVLEDLDLSGATFIKDNKYYYSDMDNMEDYGTVPGAISGYMFLGSTTLKHFAAPANTRSVQAGAFQDVANLETFTPKDIQVFGASAFANCKNLEPFPLDNVRSIGASAFSHNEKITKVVIPDELTEESFNTNAFSGCQNLVEVKIGNGVAEFSTYSFNNLPKLEKVELGNKVTTLCGNSFNDLKSLKTFVMPTAMVPTTPSMSYVTGPFENVPATAVLYVPDESVQMYSVALHWKNFTTVKPISELGGSDPDGIEDIESDANAPVRYFNLQGVELTEPSEGLCIRVQGSRSQKVIIRK